MIDLIYWDFMTDRFPYPELVRKLVDEFAKLPGIGKRSAERIAFHVLGKPREEAMQLAMSIRDAKYGIKACKICFNAADADFCPVCLDKSRDTSLIAVVELPRDILAFEKACDYRGVYHVLQGTLRPADGIGFEQLRIQELLERLKSAKVNEVILALNPTSDGDTTAAYLYNELIKTNVRITRLARGLSTGTDLESVSPSSLRFAFISRRDWNESC